MTLGDAALALSLCLGRNLDLLLRDFLTSDFFGSEALAFKFVLSLLNLDLRLALGDFRTLQGFCLLFGKVGVEACDVSARDVLTLNGLGFLLLNENTSVCFSLFLTFVRFRSVHGDLNFTGSVGFCLTHGTVSGGVGSVDIGGGDGLCSGLCTNGLDVVCFVGDVRDVHVDEVETNLVQFGVHVVDDLTQERFTVTVDLLNGERCDRQTKLTEDDFFGHVLDGGLVEVQQAHGCVLHDGGFRVDTDGKRRRYVDADVLLGKGVLEVDVNGHRLEVEEGVVLHERPDDFSAAVVTLRRAGALCVTVNDENLVGWSKFVSACSDVNRCENGDDEQRDSYQDQCIHNGHDLPTLLLL